MTNFTVRCPSMLGDTYDRGYALVDAGPMLRPDFNANNGHAS
jgi:hypothetical protein